MAKRSRLETYRKKRNFDVTPEPAPSRASKHASDRSPRFMVHKHDATRLHYDLRLEMDGALASWAIPKGPSYDPSLKRLAVQTEDHPLEYGNFEGRIPEGQYGAGDSIIWDQGTYDTVPPGQASAQRKKGHLHVRLEGEKLKGEWHLVRTRPQRGKEQWLCFKAKDGTQDASFDVVEERPESVATGRTVTRGPLRRKVLEAPHPTASALLKKVWPPMKATLSGLDDADAAGELVFEVKYDGFRGLAAISNGRLAFDTRNSIDLSGRFPHIARALARLQVAEAVLDGEVVALDPKGVSRFQLMASDDAEHRFVAFDLLWLDGEDLRGRPLEERRELLESVLANVALPITLAERVEGPAEAALAEARKRGLEGVIGKRPTSRYEGRRSRAWIKLKVNAAQELAIVGFTPIKNGSKEIGALLVGVHEKDGFHYAGKVGTGFSAKLRRELLTLLSAEQVETPSVVDAPRMRDARWVRPTLVAQVEFTEWTQDGRLRHPSFQGLRDDKRPEDVVREQQGVPSPVGKSAVKSSGTKAAEKASVTKRSAGRAESKSSAERPGSKRPVGAVSRPRRAPRQATGHRRAPASRSARSAATSDPPTTTEAPTASRVTLTHGERVLFPKSGLTKSDVFDYYRAVSPVLLPALEGRPLSIQQWPQGIGAPGFFRQSAQHAPEWAGTIRVTHANRPLTHWMVDGLDTLLLLANHSALTLHVWNSRVPHLEEPDWVVFDLDPGKRPFSDVVEVALTLRGFLEELGLDSVPKTSGKSGMHVLVPVRRGHTHQDAIDFAVAITEVLAAKLPELATTERTIARRKGRLYLDAFQNGRGKTIVAPYVLRALEGAPVSTPLRWSEVTPKLDPMDFTLRTLPKRLDKVGDLFAPALAGKARLPRIQ